MATGLLEGLVVLPFLFPFFFNPLLFSPDSLLPFSNLISGSHLRLSVTISVSMFYYRFGPPYNLRSVYCLAARLLDILKRCDAVVQSPSRVQLPTL